MTAGGGAAVTRSASFSVKPSKPAGKFSASKQRFSASDKPKRKKAVALAENLSGLKTYVDDHTLYGLISAGRVGVHKNGGWQRKGGRVYDYRQRWRVLRLNSGGREVLAFGTPERLTEKLAQIGVSLCFDHRRPQLSIGRSCPQCGSREAAGALTARGSVCAQ